MSAAYGKYLAIARAAFWQRLSERAALIGRISFYCLILLVFSCVWRSIFSAQNPLDADGEAAAHAAGDYVWYLALTEWIMLSQPSLYLDIESDVRSGDIAYQLARPLSYVGGKLAEGVGDLLLRMLTLAPFGLLFARLFSGQWADGRGLALAALVGVAAALVLLLCHAAIGLCAFWLHDCLPVYLVWQKLLFVLGGLMLPLSIYPEWLQALAQRLPFASMLYGPGQLVSHPDAGRALELSVELGAWLVLAALLVLGLERRGRRALELAGG
ncbi:MAG: ABC-2 family transporter protein [Deltaproteobacteria bacterium]